MQHRGPCIKIWVNLSLNTREISNKPLKIRGEKVNKTFITDKGKHPT